MFDEHIFNFLTWLFSMWIVFLGIGLFPDQTATFARWDHSLLSALWQFLSQHITFH